MLQFVIGGIPPKLQVRNQFMSSTIGQSFCIFVSINGEDSCQDVRFHYIDLLIDNNPSCSTLISFCRFECKKFPQRKRLTCQLATFQRQSTMFGFNNLQKEEIFYMQPPQMIMFVLSSNLHYTMFFCMVVTLGLDQIGMNCDCVRPISLVTLYKWLLQLLNSLRVPPLHQRCLTWRVKRFLVPQIESKIYLQDPTLIPTCMIM